MKKVFFLFALVILFSCSKKDSPEITGDWDMSFTVTTDSGSNTNAGTLSVVQSGSALTGTFEWGGEARPLLTNSNITDKVTIYCGDYLYYGDVNTGYDRMAGDVYTFDYFTGLFSKNGTWLATKK